MEQREMQQAQAKGPTELDFEEDEFVGRSFKKLLRCSEQRKGLRVMVGWSTQEVRVQA